MFTYQTKEEMLCHPQCGIYRAFGIVAFRVENGQEELVTSISDVFLKKEDAEAFVRKCNASKLDFIHLKDIIEDALGVCTNAAEIKGAGSHKKQTELFDACQKEAIY